MPVPDDEAAPSVTPNHSAHPGHKLKRVAGDGRDFTCNGCCMRQGCVSARYRCEHKCCAVAPATLTLPAFGVDREFKFLQVPEPPRAGRFCVRCGEPVQGFVYHCFDKDLGDDGIDLHPYCARLQENAVIRDDGSVSALGNEALASSRWKEMSDGDNRCQKVHRRRLPDARHRRCIGKQDPPAPAEITQPNNPVFDLRRQEASRPSSDTSGVIGRVPAAARHRSRKPQQLHLDGSARGS